MSHEVLDDLLACIGFVDDDAARLRGLHPKLEPHFADIAGQVFAALSTSLEQIEGLRITLIHWMSSRLLGQAAMGLHHRYMFTAMNVMRTAYHDHVGRLYPAAEAALTMRSVHKLLDIELAIMAGDYQIDSAARLDERERRMQADRLVAMQTLTAGLAHEVRNPLNAAKLQLQLLERRLRRTTDDPRLVEPSQVAQKEIERLTVLLNEFLVFAKPPELYTDDSDVVPILRQVAELERGSAERRGAELTLVACPEHLIARIDAAKIHQIVLNLVRNAIEAVSGGGHVELELAGDDGQICIRVKDDGSGIPDAVLPRIYEPFFSTKETGTGLGMSIVHSLVKLHGGSIALATSPRGTQFEISIPRRTV